MAIKGLNKYDSQIMPKFADGNFEDMLRKCHDFGDGAITIKRTDGIYTAVDANQKTVVINIWPGDPDDFDDTVYVYDGEICEYISRLDNGEYDITTGEVPQKYKYRFDLVLAKANDKGISRKFKKLFNL